MKYSDAKVAGALLFVGTVQFIIGLMIAEALYPGYSVSANYISDLGVGDSSLIFNSSAFLLGLMILTAVYFIHRIFTSRLFITFVVLAGVGVMGVGLFPETAGVIHTIVSLITFLFSGLSAIVSYRLQKPPMSYFAVLLGAVTLLALALFGSGSYLGLGRGGMERMITYPVLLWNAGFGGYLMSHGPEEAKTG
jgi:hypothetical membrane protein